MNDLYTYVYLFIYDFYRERLFYNNNNKISSLFSGTRCSRNNTESLNNNIRLTGSSATFCSPDYDTFSTYPANMSCTWIISFPKDDARIKLSFSVFDLQTSNRSCENGDFLQVQDGEFSDSPVLGTFCGDTIPNDLYSSGKFIKVYFHSDASVEKRGFVSSYDVLHEEKNGKYILTECKISKPAYTVYYTMLLKFFPKVAHFLRLLKGVTLFSAIVLHTNMSFYHLSEIPSFALIKFHSHG